MRYTRALIPTLKEAPSDATSVSHVLLLRTGYARRVGAGIYSYLPLDAAAQKVLELVQQALRASATREAA